METDASIDAGLTGKKSLHTPLPLTMPSINGRAGIRSEWWPGSDRNGWPGSRRNGGRMPIGMHGRNRRNPHPARFDPDLGISLNNLSNYLSDTGDTAAALAAIWEAVEIRRLLAQANPARFDPDLGGSLGNLGLCLHDSGNIPAARTALEEAVRLLAPYAKHFPGSPPAQWYAFHQRNLSILLARLKP